MLRRRSIYDKVVLEMQYKLFYVESICDDPSIVESNIRVSKAVGDCHNIGTQRELTFTL